MKNEFQTLSVLTEDVEFVEKLLHSKGLMYVQENSMIFPFSQHHKGFVYKFYCDTFTKIEILNILNQAS